MNDETAIPVFPCSSPETTLDFYQTLGFEITHRQIKPYVYLAVKHGRLDLHFYGGAKPDPNGSFLCLVMVSDVEPYHRAFAASLKQKHGRVPTAGLPRISRLRKGQKRFTVVDPDGNSLLYIARDEPEYEYPDKEAWARFSPMERALKTAANFRDMRRMDASALKVLEVALKKNPEAAPIEQARALAAIIELAVAMENPERAQSARDELGRIPLSDEERSQYRDELMAPDAIDRMKH